jgi:hypothetical protein
VGEDLEQQEQESQCAGLRKAVLRDSRGWGVKTWGQSDPMKSSQETLRNKRKVRMGG